MVYHNPSQRTTFNNTHNPGDGESIWIGNNIASALDNGSVMIWSPIDDERIDILALIDCGKSKIISMSWNNGILASYTESKELILLNL